MKSNKQVLLVDDDEDIRTVIIEVLEMEGIETEVATNGEEALEKLKDHPENLPRLILLDLMMPKFDGIWFCKEREKYPEFNQIPVIILSADGETATKTMGVSISGILKKPVEISVLCDVLHKYVH
jgi:CheY-like chemotaxis protein